MHISQRQSTYMYYFITIVMRICMNLYMHAFEVKTIFWQEWTSHSGFKSERERSKLTQVQSSSSKLHTYKFEESKIK